MALQSYLGEANGGRVIRYGTGLTTRITTGGTQAVNLDVDTWDLTPLGPTGEVIFRTCEGVIRYSNGYDIQITPIIDGVALPPQRFTGSGSGETEIEAFIARRGSRARAQIATLNRAGSIELDNFVFVYVPLRVAP